MEYREYRGEEPRARPPHDGSVRTLSNRELVDELIGQAQRLVREEVRLARAELSADAKNAAAGGGVLGAAGALGLVGLIVFSFALVYLWALLIPIWGAALVVTGLLLLLAGGLALIGRSLLKRARPVPEETLETLEEDRRWARGMTRDVRSRVRGNA